MGRKAKMSDQFERRGLAIQRRFQVPTLLYNATSRRGPFYNCKRLCRGRQDRRSDRDRDLVASDWFTSNDW